MNYAISSDSGEQQRWVSAFELYDMTQKEEHYESISVEYEGVTHTGRLVISGTRKLTFTVEYRGRKSADGRAYGTSADELHNLRTMAEVHLVRILGDFERS